MKRVLLKRTRFIESARSFSKERVSMKAARFLKRTRFDESGAFSSKERVSMKRVLLTRFGEKRAAFIETRSKTRRFSKRSKERVSRSFESGAFFQKNAFHETRFSQKNAFR